TDGTVRMGNSSSAANTLTTPVHWDNTWRHYAFSFNATGGILTGYINGVQFDQAAGVAATTVSTTAWQFFARNSATNGLAFGGYESTWRMWKDVKTQAQIQADMNNTRNTTN